MENWKDCAVSDRHQVSDCGRVRNKTTEKVLTGTVRKDGYIQVCLQNKVYLVHRLVLLTFAGQPDDGMVSCHGNGNPADNRLVNLRWDTESANQYDKVNHGRHSNALKTHCVKGHEFTEANSYIWNNRRMCRTCNNEYSRLKRLKKKVSK